MARSGTAQRMIQKKGGLAVRSGGGVQYDYNSIMNSPHEKAMKNEAFRCDSCTANSQNRGVWLTEFLAALDCCNVTVIQRIHDDYESKVLVLMGLWTH